MSGRWLACWLNVHPCWCDRHIRVADVNCCHLHSTSVRPRSSFRDAIQLCFINFTTVQVTPSRDCQANEDLLWTQWILLHGRPQLNLRYQNQAPVVNHADADPPNKQRLDNKVQLAFECHFSSMTRLTIDFSNFSIMINLIWSLSHSLHHPRPQTYN